MANILDLILPALTGASNAALNPAALQDLMQGMGQPGATPPFMPGGMAAAAAPAPIAQTPTQTPAPPPPAIAALMAARTGPVATNDQQLNVPLTPGPQVDVPPYQNFNTQLAAAALQDLLNGPGPQQAPPPGTRTAERGDRRDRADSTGS